MPSLARIQIRSTHAVWTDGSRPSALTCGNGVGAVDTVSHHHFLQGAAYKLGSGAVTLLILWWETRH